MNLPNYDSPTDLKEFLDFFGFGMQKKFGQNFLVDRNIRIKLINSLNLKKGDKIWEVGPGLGAMSAMLLEAGVDLTAFEIDNGFIGILKNLFKDFNLIEGDVLKTWQKELKLTGKPDIFFGNLPYNIATELILDTIKNLVVFNKVLITVQKEVAQKITAQANTKNYCTLSVLCNWLYDCKIVELIPSSSFWPQPHIESAAVLFVPKQYNNNFGCKNPQLFIKTVKALFSSRRKTIKNNLQAWLRQAGYGNIVDDILKKADLAENLRAENLSLFDFLKLSDIIVDEETSK